MPAPEQFETPRLRAERLRPDHIAELDAFHRDEEVMATLGGTRDRASTEEYLARNLRHWDEHGFGVWVLRRSGSPEFAGRAILRHLEIEGSIEVEIGYALTPVCWGQGLATEAGARCVEIAWSALGLRGLVGVTTPDNLASQRVLTKLGFAREGDMRVEGWDLVVMRLRRAEDA